MPGLSGPRRRYRALQTSLADARGREVVFLSHCLLNQNTRYLGGAGCRGVVSAAVTPYLQDGTGIVQMPCPEQRVWGGVLKTRMLWLIEHRRLARLASLTLPVVQRYVRWRYARLAHGVVAEVEDYLVSGLSVRGIVGVAGSPSCGVHTTLDLKRCAAALAASRRGPTTTGWLNATVIAPALVPGTGLFARELQRRIEYRRLPIVFGEEAIPIIRGVDPSCS